MLVVDFTATIVRHYYYGVLYARLYGTLVKSSLNFCVVVLYSIDR